MGLLLRPFFFITHLKSFCLMKPSSIRSRGYQYKDPAIYRKLMVDTLEYWRDCRPAFYSLLSILPPTSFRIIADDDYRDVRDEWTIPDFMENRKLFHPRLTCFTICFQTYIYRSEWYDCDPNWNKTPGVFLRRREDGDPHLPGTGGAARIFRTYTRLPAA